MTTTQIIKSIMKATKITQFDICEATGMKQANVNSKINRPNLTMDTLMELLDVLGYSVVIMPKGAKVKDSWYTVTRE